jgi:eukaryotic-like serine/threonine-protein kinase
MDDPTVPNPGASAPVNVVSTTGGVLAPFLFGKRFRPIALLGRGGMGSVYLTRDVELDELIAVKMLLSSLTRNKEALGRFRDEVRLARRVSNPFVARTHDLVEHEGRWFVTMQYIDGENLRTKVAREGRLPLGKALAIARDVCEGLTAVHAAGVVHRDLKPANVLITKDGHAVLTDFGIALRADTAQTTKDTSGTPRFTAPEQLAGAPTDVRADIFGLGAILFAMVTGHPPFPEKRVGLEDAPDPRALVPDLPEAFASLVMRTMAPDPQDRPASAAAVRLALDMVPTQAKESVVESALSRFVRKLGAGAGRRLSIQLESEGVASMLVEAARMDLIARLNARDDVRVVSSAPEATLALSLTAPGGGLAVDAMLRSASDGCEFLHERFEADPAALPQLVERLAHAIECAFSPGERPLRDGEWYPSAGVANLVINARSEYRAFWSPNLRKSVELFERAIELAPDHSLLLAWCAAACARRAIFDPDAEEAMRARGRELAERAVALAPDLPEAHVALASSHVNAMNVVEGVRHFIQALGVAPGLLEQRAHLGRIIYECGAVEPALALANAMLEAVPAYTEPLEMFVRDHAFRRDIAAARSVAAKASEDVWVGAAYARTCFWLRDRARFEEQYAQLHVEKIDANARAVLVTCRALMANQKGALNILEPAVGNARRRVLFHQLRAEAFAFADDRRRCLEELEQGAALGLFDSRWIDLLPLFEPLRGTLRFERTRRTVHEQAFAVLSTIESSLGAE